MSEWQPIETAPRDGTIILGLVCIGTHSEAPAYEPQPMYHVGLVMWTREAFRFREPRVMPATHWQPFNPPQQA